MRRADVYGVDPKQLRELVVRPTLGFLKLGGQAAENLVVGTALVESGLSWLHQRGAGPALGLWQMEPATHDSLWDNYLGYRSKLSADVLQLATPASITEGATEMVGNLFYACAMARVYYRTKKAPLPAADDVDGMAAYWKLHYNTALGAGTVAHALPHFRVACRG